jgi:glycosyltransferase involved in cell wall biosynthesis
MNVDRLALLTAPEVAGETTGGHLFDRLVLERAAAHGVSVDVIALAEAPLWLRAAAARAALARCARDGVTTVVVDSIVAGCVALALPAARPYTTVGLVHQRPGGALGSKAGAALESLAYRRLDFLIATSEWLAKLLRPLGVPVSVVGPGRDLAPAAEARADLRLGRQAAILCVANWLPHKGLLDVLEAVARLPDDAATLHLVGGARGAYARRVAELASRADLRHRVVIHGPVPHTRLSALYAAADVFACAARDEAYGIAAAEALAAGVPVVAYGSGNLEYLVRHGTDGLLVPAGDIEALSWALCLLALDDDLRTRLGSNARERGAALPTWDESASAFFSVLRRGTRLAPAA